MAVAPFSVLIASGVLEQLEEAIVLAGRQGRRDEAVAAGRAINNRLRWLADEFGESRYPLKLMGELRVAIIGPLGVIFSVHAERHEVNVGRFRLIGLRHR